MAGEANVVSGLAGVTQVPQQQEGGDGLLQIVKAVQAIKQNKQQQAQQNLKLQLDLLKEHGIAPDEKVFKKTLEEAGIPSTAVESLSSGQAGAKMDPAAVTKMGSVLQNQSGAQAAFPASANAAAKNPGGGVVKTVPSGTGVVEKGVAQSNTQGGTGGGFDLNGIVARAQERINTAQTTEQMKAHLDQTIVQLRQRAGEGDSEATGKLMAMGGVQLTPDQAMWASATPQERQKMIGIAAGQESDMQKETRISNQAMTLWNSGRFTDLQDARAFAEGKIGVFPKPDLSRMGDEAKLSNELFSLGLSGDQAKQVGEKMANGVSLSDALPAGVTPVIQQQLKMQRDQLSEESRHNKTSEALQNKGLDIEASKFSLSMKQEQAKTSLEAQKLLLALREADDKSFNSRFDNMVNGKRNKVPIPKDMEQNMINELATRSGMTPEQVHNVWDYLGYTTFQYPPTVNEHDQKVLDQGTGAPQKKVGDTSGSSGIPPIGDILDKGLGGINSVMDAIGNLGRK